MNANYNIALKEGSFLKVNLLQFAGRVVEMIHKFEETNPNWNNPNTERRERRMADRLYDAVPSPKLITLKYLYLYICEIDIDEWQGPQTDAKSVAEQLIRGALESEIGGSKYIYFKRKLKSDIILAEYLKGGNISEQKLHDALSDIEEDYDKLKQQARQYSNHELRYDTIRTRNAHARKMRTLQGALSNIRARELHPIIIHPNKSKSIGIGNRVRRALKFW
jgi:hypothetical protein